MKFPKRFFKKVVGRVLQAHDCDIEVRCLHQFRDEESFWPKQYWFRSVMEFEAHWPEIEELREGGYDVNFTVVPRLRKFQGKKEHPLPEMLVVCSLWVDLDVGEGKPYRTKPEALNRVRDVKPFPNIIVESGSGLHCYYILKTPCQIKRDQLEVILAALARLLNGDKGAARATRLMRVPNTRNWKLGANRSRLARHRHLSGKVYRLHELERHWSAQEAHHCDRGTKKAKVGRLHSFFKTHLHKFIIRTNGEEATPRCPFHDDQHPSFSVNLNTGLWLCRAESCGGKGNIEQFCDRLHVPLPSELAERLDGFPLDSSKKSIPPKLSERALYGPAGNFVRAIEPHSEADPVALLSQLLAAFGSCVGPRPYFQVEATKHRINLFVLVVGASSKARKGTALDHVKRVLDRVDPKWSQDQIKTGLSSGEGLIFAVHDYDPRIDKPKKDKTDSEPKLQDKRLLVVQPEFAGVLRASRGEHLVSRHQKCVGLRQSWNSYKECACQIYRCPHFDHRTRYQPGTPERVNGDGSG